MAAKKKRAKKNVPALAAPDADATEESAGEEKLSLAKAQELLAPFLKDHPYSEVAELHDPAGHKGVVIARPWGDESLLLFCPGGGFEVLAAALNNVYLPERFTAIWHKDTKRFEVIWTAHPIPPGFTDAKSRKFKFRFSGKEYECEFRASSRRLLAIATLAITVANTRTGHRNLPSFTDWAHRQMKAKMDGDNSKTEAPQPQEGEPLSFWIQPVEWNEDAVLQLVENLNFYMSYYDTRTPTILIHSPKPEADNTQPQTRFVIGRFPNVIDGRERDSSLLSLWAACHSGDAARRFLYAFRLIEYASFSYLEADARNQIRRILASPHALDDLSNVTDEVVSAVRAVKLEDYNRIEALLDATVNPSLLWREIEANKAQFSADNKFDGGLVVGKLIDANSRESDFLPKGVSIFHQAATKIRNALAHGKEQRTSAVIAPTIRNFERLQPWVSLITVAAGQVLINKDV